MVYNYYIMHIYIYKKILQMYPLQIFSGVYGGYVGGALPPAPFHKEFPVVMVFPLKKCTLEL